MKTKQPVSLPLEDRVKKPSDFLDELRARYNLRFDSDVGALMGWKPQQTSRYRRNLNLFFAENATKIEQALGYPKGYVRIHMSALQMPDEPDIGRSLAWLAAKHLGKTAAAVLVGVGLAATPLPAPAASGASGPVCIMLNNRWLRMLGISPGGMAC